MKKMTLWQRLRTALVLLIALLLLSIGLVLWVEEIRAACQRDGARLTAALQRANCSLSILSDSLRGVLLNGKVHTDQKRREAAREDLARLLEAVRTDFGEDGDLVQATEAVQSYLRDGWDPFQKRVLEMAEDDLAGAGGVYEKNWPDLFQQSQGVVEAFSRKIDAMVAAQNRQSRMVALIGVSGLVLILAAGLIIGKLQSEALTEPLQRLVGALDRMRQGDFSKPLDLDCKDEFGVLGKGLDRLGEELSLLVGQVQRSGLQVNSTASHIATAAKEQQATAREIAATVSEIGTASKEITATSQALVRTMNEVSQVAEQTAKLAEGGRAALSGMEDTMRQMRESSGAISAKLAVLNEKTTNINSVVTTITKVADQTNLLSLNAAIEAEKAGEYGLGFAVVAMEIRRLADQTAVATYDIEKMVKEMQNSVSAGVMGMDKFSDEVRRGTEQVRTAGQHLGQIMEQVQALTPRFQTVNTGMNAQAGEARQISETLLQLGEAARHTADSLRRSNQAIEELNQAASALQDSVARFRLIS